MSSHVRVALLFSAVFLGRMLARWDRLKLCNDSEKP